MIKIYQSNQGLLSVGINDKFSDWKIANRGGVWNLYKTSPYHKIQTDLTKFIHKPELPKIVGDLISDYEIENDWFLSDKTWEDYCGEDE